MKRNKRLIIVVTGPSGAGKSTILKDLPQDEFYFSVSHTTRAPRPGEEDGKHYYFISRSVFLEMIERDEFLEWVEVFGTFYGTAKTEVEKAFTQNKHLVLDIEVVGATRLKSYFGSDAIFIFIAPPDLQSLKTRIIQRGTENEAEVQNRLKRAKEELRFASWFDYVIVNETLEKSKELFFSIVKAELSRPYRNHQWKIFLSNFNLNL
ncbi:guanylate kinase [Thermodesulfobacterium hveragerdense]|uniref:guanylate kinase n=1 Tax=Thermodesulfobacterium hveragerdense TaxID=53424 RepID=UPI00048DB9EA|nr:guanylate kinase [Thermodesulfobacterium hveragerdense]